MQAGTAHTEKTWPDIMEGALLVSYDSNLQKVQTVSDTEPDPLAEVQQLLFLSQGGRRE